MASSKQPKLKKSEKNSREKQMISAKEKVMKIRRDVLQIVESLLEENISKNLFLEGCKKLCKQDYDDVVQERSIESICGYPLCDNAIKQVPKQQYHISRSANKVYDLTERKCFCCNECYKASNFVKAQLSEIPLYMRKVEKSGTINLISDSDNRGSAGEEIVFIHSLSKEELEVPCPEASLSNHLPNILQQEIKGCEEQLSNLKIKENVYEKVYVFNSQNQEKAKGTSNQDSILESSEEEDDTDDDEEDECFQNYDNSPALSNKLMPIPDQTKKAVLIPPQKLTDVSSPPVTTHLSFEIVRNVFQDWFTEDTLKFLLGEKKLYSLKADILFQTMVNSESPSPEKLSSVKNEYIDICLKMDALKDEVSDSEEVFLQTVPHEDGPGVENFSGMVAEETKSKPYTTKSNPKRKTRKKSKEKNKTVTFAGDVKKESDVPNEKVEPVSEESEANHSLSEPQFPLVDSVSQNALRKQVLTSKLRTVYFDILPVVGLHYKDIQDGVKKIMETFSLTPKNITFKPKEWKCIGLVLLRILSKTTLKDLESYEDFDFSKLIEATKVDFKISMQEIEDLVINLTGSNQVQRLQGLV